MIVVELLSVFKVLAKLHNDGRLLPREHGIGYQGISEIFIDLRINKIDGELHD